jgi:hypothetical protein
MESGSGVVSALSVYAGVWRVMSGIGEGTWAEFTLISELLRVVGGGGGGLELEASSSTRIIL